MLEKAAFPKPAAADAPVRVTQRFLHNRFSRPRADARAGHFLFGGRVASGTVCRSNPDTLWAQFQMLLGMAIFSIGLAAYVFCSVWLMFFWRFAHYQAMRIEEPRLRARFGEAYEQYCGKVPRWLPRPPDESSRRVYH